VQSGWILSLCLILLTGLHPILVEASETKPSPALSTETKAAALSTIRAQQLQKEQARQHKREQLLAVPALLEVEDTYADGSRIRFRKVATPNLKPQQQPEVIPQPSVAPISNLATPLDQPVKTTNITLTITPADQPGHSLLHWKEGKHHWKIMTNADLRGFEHVHHIPLNQQAMSVFVLNLQTQAALPSDEVYFEIIGEQAPTQLVKQIEALHDYYLQHQQQMLSDWQLAQARQQAQADLEATQPEAPQETVINFFKIR